MLVPVDFVVLDVIVARELPVASDKRKSSFTKIVLQVTVSGINEMPVLGIKLTGLMSGPGKTGIFS